MGGPLPLPHTLCTVYSPLYYPPPTKSILTGVSIGFPLWLSSKFNESLVSSAKCVVVGVLVSQVSAGGGRDQERPGAGSVFGLYTAAVRRGGRKTIKPKGLKLRKDRRVGRVGQCLELYSLTSSLYH